MNRDGQGFAAMRADGTLGLPRGAFGLRMRADGLQTLTT